MPGVDNKPIPAKKSEGKTAPKPVKPEQGVKPEFKDEDDWDGSGGRGYSSRGGGGGGSSSTVQDIKPTPGQLAGGTPILPQPSMYSLPRNLVDCECFEYELCVGLQGHVRRWRNGRRTAAAAGG